MNKILATVLFFTIFLIFSCKTDDPIVEPPNNGGGGNSTSDFVVETIIPTGDENYLNQTSDYLFDQSKLPVFEINLPNASLAELDNDPAAEEYVEGSLTFEGETISPVGVRYKGSVGAFVGCLSGTDWANPSGYKTCTKLSLKIKINWEGREEKFFGLKKVQLHAMNLDDSQMRDRLGYWLFREMGVPAPRAVHAKVYINGEYSGVYAFIEQIDGRFTRYNFDDGKGNLYKEIWPLHSNGQPHADQTYLNHLKTNEDENPSVDLIKTFAQEVAEAEDAELQNIIEKWMDIDEVITYAVVDRTIRNDDGAFHWYCTGNVCSPHNFFWYEEPDNEKLHLIPWDLDNAFENIISDQNPVTPIADAWGETTNNCLPFNYGTFNLRQKSAACDKLIGGWASYESEYQTKLTAFKNGPLSKAQINAQLDTWKAQIRDATEEARQKYNDAVPVSNWEYAMEQLKEQLDHARDN